MLRLTPFFFFLACSEDEKVTAIYNAPLIVMDRPAQIYEYSEITLTGVISYQNDINELSVSWTFDGVAVCPDAGINAREEGGLTSCTISIGETGSYSVGVVVSDGVGSGSDSHEFDALANPLAVSIESPTLGDVLNEGENVLFSAAITDDSNDSLQVQWTSDHPDQGEIVLNSSEVTPAEGSQFVYNDLPIGAQLLKVRVSDNSNSNAIDSMQIEVNDCPTAPEVSIDPASSSENLRARIDSDSVNLFTPSGGNFSYTYAWYQDGLLRSEFTDTTVPSSEITRGEEWEVRVTATDGFCESSSGIATVVVGNSPPVLSTVNIDASSGVAAGIPLTCTVGASDPDGDSLVYTYTWRNSTTGANLDTRTLTTADDTYTVAQSAISQGDSIQCEVSVSDGVDSAGPLSDVVSANNAAPVLNSLTIIPNAGVTATTTLYCVPDYVEPDGQAVTESYVWTNDSTGATLGLADTLTLSAATATAGDVITCDFTVSDGSLSATDMASVTVANNNPTATVSLSPLSGITTSSTLTCSAVGVDPDGDSLSFSFDWSNTTTSTSITGVSGTSASTLTLSSALASPGDSIQCQVTADDGNGGSDVVAQSAIVGNSAPTLSLQLSPANAISTDTIDCTATGADPDGDTLSYSFSWSNVTSGAALSGTSTGNTSSLSLVGNSAGDEISCSATVTDGSDSATATSSLIIANQDPMFSAGAQITPATAVSTSEALTCSASASDPDGGSVTLTYLWENISTGMIVGNRAGLTLSPYLNFPNEVISCTVTATDSMGGTASSSATVTTENSDPVVSSVSITPGAPTTSDTVTCSASVSDPDTEAPTVTTSWTRVSDGSQLGTGSSLTLTPASISPMEDLQCTISATDGYGATTTASTTVTIANTAPVVSNVSISPAGPSLGDSVTCSASSSDADGDSLTDSIEWSSNGTVLGSGATYTVSGAISYSDPLTCTWTSTDTHGASGSASATTQVMDQAPVVTSVSISGTGSLAVEDELTCNVQATDPEGDPIFIAYSWLVNGAQVTGGASMTISAGTASRGDSIVCAVTVTDLNGNSSNGSSTAITVGNAAPSTDLAQFLVNGGPALSATSSDSLSCVGVNTSDPDGDAVTETILWYQNGLYIGSGSSFPGTLNRGDSIECQLTPNDGLVDGSTVTGTMTISNATPTVSAVLIDPDPAYTDSTLSVLFSSSDPDGDVVTITYDWQVNGQTVSSGSTLDGALFSRGDSVIVTLTPDDGVIQGSAVSSAALSISNTAPGAPSLSISPVNPSADDDLYCVVETDSADADNDSITYTYSWTVDGINANIGSDMVPYTQTTDQQVWECTATPSDGITTGAIASAAATITGIRPDILLCGSSGASIPSILATTGLSFSISSGCSPDSNTQAMFVTRYGTTNGTWASYVQNGGIIISEYSSSDEIFSAVFQSVNQGSGHGACSDNFTEVVQFNTNDPFWQDLGWNGQIGSTGCGHDVSNFPGVTALAGWNGNAVSTGYRESGSGRVWFADFDWQDGGLNNRTLTVLGYMAINK